MSEITIFNTEENRAINELAIEAVEDMRQRDIISAVTQLKKIEIVYGMDATEIIVDFKNQNNNDRGLSTMKLAQRYNINGMDAMRQLRTKGWTDDKNNITLSGIMESNNLAVGDTFNMNTDKIVFQNRASNHDGRGGGVYWDTIHPLFKSTWQRIVDACEEREHNEMLKLEHGRYGKTAKALITRLGETGQLIVIPMEEEEEEGEENVNT